MMPRVTLCRAGAQVEDVRTPSLERELAGVLAFSGLVERCWKVGKIFQGFWSFLSFLIRKILILVDLVDPCSRFSLPSFLHCRPQDTDVGLTSCSSAVRWFPRKCQRLHAGLRLRRCSSLERFQDSSKMRGNRFTRSRSKQFYHL